MNKIGSFIYIVACMLMLFTACKEEDMAFDSPHHGPDKPMNAIFELNLALDQPAHSRAIPDSTTGYFWERSLNTLHLFAVPYTDTDGNIKEDWTRVSKATAKVPADWKPGGTIRVPINLITTGTMKVYVGANLSYAQETAFINSPDYTVTEGTYYQSINEFAPFKRRDDYKEDYYRQPENIAMFCREAGEVNTTKKPLKTEDTNPVYKVGNIYLQRMVAKVLVTCQPKRNELDQGDKEDVNYVELKGQLVDTEKKPQGWIRQENVYYFINNMPRKAKFMLRYEDTNNDGTKELQAHYNLKEIFDKLTSGTLPLEFNPEVKDYFIHYALLDLFRYEQSFKQSLVWDESWYDKLINSSPNSENPYNQKGVGMYTLENLFELKTTQEGTAGTDQEFSQAQLEILWNYKALPIITQVSIAAKFVPRYIYMTAEEWKNGDNPICNQILKIDNETKTLEDWIGNGVELDTNSGYLSVICPNEAVAQAILTKSIERKDQLENPYNPDDHPTKFPNDTFFAYTRPESLGGGTVYCTYGVAISFGEQGKVDETMVPYPNGWGYYYTYINSEENAPINGKEDLKSTYILRNTYYILKVTGITQLGSTITDSNYMKVHTLKAAWQDGGSGGITLN